MLYLEITPEAMRFYSMEGDTLQQTSYRMQPTLNFDRNLRQAVASMPQMSETPQAVRVIVTSPGTAMPLNDFCEEISEDVFRQCFPDRTGQQVFYDMIPESSAVWLFALPREHCKALEGLFGEVFYVHAVTPLARYALQQAAQNERLVLVNCRVGTIDVVVVMGNRLLMANTYEVGSSYDATFYTLNVSKRLQVDCLTDHFIVGGEKELREGLLDELLNFAPRTEQRHDLEKQLLRYQH